MMIVWGYVYAFKTWLGAGGTPQLPGGSTTFGKKKEGRASEEWIQHALWLAGTLGCCRFYPFLSCRAQV